MQKNNNLQSKSLIFWIHISKYYLALKNKKYFEVASQLFRSGTSIWANIKEAQGSESTKDFLHKLQISLKEAYETLYWLDILSQWFNEDTKILIYKCEELVKILVSITKSLKQKLWTAPY